MVTAQEQKISVLTTTTNLHSSAASGCPEGHLIKTLYLIVLFVSVHIKNLPLWATIYFT